MLIVFSSYCTATSAFQVLLAHLKARRAAARVQIAEARSAGQAFTRSRQRGVDVLDVLAPR